MTDAVIRPVLAIMLVAATPAATQTVPVTTLGKPLAEFPEGYARLNGLRELPDGRVLTIEQCERVVKLLDLATGVDGVVGRTGAGPGEYRTPSRLFALPGDSSAIYDPGNSRFLIIRPDGKPGGFFDPLPTVNQASGSLRMAIRFTPSATDSLGRFYGREAGLLEAGASLIRAESVAVERWNHRSGKRDTIAFHRTLNPGPVVLGQQDVPFTTGIQWAVARDGRVALVHPNDFHVDLLGPTRVREVGKPISFERVRVTEGHKQQWREDQKPPCGGPSGAITFTTTEGRTGTAVRKPTPEPAVWPEFLPPFLSGAVLFAPHGVLWVRRTVPADAPPGYDLIDGRGNLVRRVVLPKRTKLLGFGRGSLYLVRMDDDDLQYLQRYPLPATLALP